MFVITACQGKYFWKCLILYRECPMSRYIQCVIQNFTSGFHFQAWALGKPYNNDIIVVVVIIIIIIIISCCRPFLPGTSLEPTVIPLPSCQISDCNTFYIMCDVSSIAVFCCSYIECLPSRASKFLFKAFVAIPVAPVITGVMIHFIFCICCSSINKLSYFSFFPAFFCMTFLTTTIATYRMHVLYILFLIIISGLFAVILYPSIP